MPWPPTILTRHRRSRIGPLYLSYSKVGGPAAKIGSCYNRDHCRFRGTAMSDVTQILSRIESGDPTASEQLLPIVYEELRNLASQRIAQEKPGQTLQATALVHEAYMRLVDGAAQRWDNRGHFFAAAAEAMRRILVENVRRKGRKKHGGDDQWTCAVEMLKN